MSIVLDGTTGLAGAATGALNGTLGATTPSTVAATTVTAATTMGVGNATPSASGAGITFPATQSASTDANTLDDYEEGTWTPNQGGGLTIVGTFSSSGTYTKIGRVVFITGTVQGSTSVACSSAGVISSNLPFSASTNGATGGLISYYLGQGAVTCLTLSSTIYSSSSVSATPGIEFSAVYRVA